MKMIAFALFVILLPSITGQTTFTEGFEDSLAKWEILGGQGGSVETTTLYARSGTHSLMIKTTQVGGIGEAFKKYVRHAFGQGTVGVVSVWFYDTGNPNAALVVLKDASGNETSMGRMDAGGSVSPGYVYRFGGAEYTGSVPYSPGWHLFSFSVSSGGTKYSIDGTVQNAVNPDFDSFSEMMLGTFSGVSSEQYWDDVSVSPLCTLISPAITSPSSNYNFSTPRPSFAWTLVSGADSYTIQILSGDIVILEKTGITTDVYTTESDLAQDIYVFRIKAVSSNCESDWSQLPFLISAQSTNVTIKVKSQGVPVPDANVSLTPGQTLPFFLSTKTDASGQAVFQNVAGGSYTLKVEKENFTPHLSTLTVEKSIAIEVELGIAPSLSLTSDKESYACNETVVLNIKGPRDSSVALMVKRGEEVVYTDTVKTGSNGEGSSSFAIAEEGALVATASVEGATANARFSIACAPPQPAKISVKIQEYGVIDSSSRPKSSFKPGQMVGFLIVVKNDSNTDVTVLVLNQVKDPKLISVFTGYVKVTLAPGQAQEISLGFALPTNANVGSFTCQAMVWSDWAINGGVAYASTESTFNVGALW